MSNVNVMKALAKVIVALAWADGSVSNEEVNQLKELLLGLPGMTASDWAEVDIYVDSPVGETERQRLVAELQDTLGNSQDKQLVLAALDDLVKADGKISEEERLAYTEIRNAVESKNVNSLSRMGRLLKQSPSHSSQVSAASPNRERFLEDYIKNRIFYNVSRRLELEKTEVDISEAMLRKLSLAGGLMARIALVDNEVRDHEIEMMVKALRDHWGVSEFEANLVAEVAVSDISKGLDSYQLSSQFFDCTTDDERLHFLDALFAVAAGHGGVSFVETEEIRSISIVLKQTHQQFIAAKLKIPIELRPSDSISGSG